eukprot:UN09912
MYSANGLETKPADTTLAPVAPDAAAGGTTNEYLAPVKQQFITIKATTIFHVSKVISRFLNNLTKLKLMKMVLKS